MQIPLLGTYRCTELLGRRQGGGVSSLTIFILSRRHDHVDETTYTLRLAVADLTKDMGQVTMTIRYQLGPPHHANGICSSFTDW